MSKRAQVQQQTTLKESASSDTEMSEAAFVETSNTAGSSSFVTLAGSIDTMSTVFCLSSRTLRNSYFERG